MKRYFYTIVLLFISCTFIYAQEVKHEVRCYYAYGETQLDTLYSIEYTIQNNSERTQVIMITEDNKRELPMNKIIRRRLLKRYGDLSFAQMAWDNIENLSDYPVIPEFFIKTIQPGDSFKITIELKNEDVNKVNSLFKDHLLLLNAEDIDNKDMVNGLLSAVKEYHFEYPYSSISIPWYVIEKFIGLKHLLINEKIVSLQTQQ